MAGSSMNFSYDEGHDGSGLPGGVRKVIVDWISDDTTGAVSGTSRKVVGELVKAVTDPGADSLAPTDDYDVAITDDDGANVLSNCVNTLDNRDTANSEETVLGLSDGGVETELMIAAFPVVCSKLTISVSNAGNSKAGRLVLYVR